MPPRGVILQEARLSAPYRRRLASGAAALAEWASQTGRLIGRELASGPAANEFLIAYIQHVFDTGGPVWLPTHAILAVQTARRDLKGLLRPAWDSIQSWRLMSPVHSRAPLPVALLEGLRIFAVLAAASLDKQSAASWWNFAAVCGGMFWGLLRPGELFDLKNPGCGCRTGSRFCSRQSRF